MFIFVCIPLYFLKTNKDKYINCGGIIPLFIRLFVDWTSFTYFYPIFNYILQPTRSSLWRRARFYWLDRNRCPCKIWWFHFKSFSSYKIRSLCNGRRRRTTNESHGIRYPTVIPDTTTLATSGRYSDRSSKISSNFTARSGWGNPAHNHTEFDVTISFR